MVEFVNKVRSTCQRYRLLKPKDKVIVAVSGGADSVSMLLALQELAPEYELQLFVAHLNHLMRGDQAEADANWVKELSAQLGVPFYRRDTDVPALIAEQGLTVEQAGRVARYAFYRDLAQQLDATKVAVGQTQDDQAETILLHLVRGSGLTGIAGIRPKRRATYGWVIRPLLEVTRKETEACSAAFGLVPRHDPYNVDPAYLRNRIRYRLLPWLRDEANPNIKEVLAQSAAVWQEEDQYLKAVAKKAYSKLIRTVNKGVALDVAGLLILPLALKRRVLRQAYAAAAGDHRNLSFDHTESLLALGSARVGTVLHLPRGVQAQRTYSEIMVTSGCPEQERIPNFCYRLAVPGLTPIAELGLQLRTAVGVKADICPDSLVAMGSFDYNETGSNLFVRNRRRGDWFYPQGVGGRKKLSDFLIDCKVPRQRRDRVLLVTNRTDIVWVAGFRVDERFIVRATTAEQLFIYVQKMATDKKEEETFDLP